MNTNPTLTSTDKNAIFYTHHILFLLTHHYNSFYFISILFLFTNPVIAEQADHRYPKQDIDDNFRACVPG